ncbi:STAS domain-containing protein [Streptomyces sp. NPDC059900]|uniref:STAS domain-containing protein n=1 Tax=Streptomyces sp. NPDC059900 TaxID=3155816 RepID=UPI00342A079E
MPSSSRPQLTVEQHAREGAWVLVVGGELDAGTIAPLHRAARAAAAAVPTVVLDLGGVTFADSSALNLLIALHHSTALRVAAPQAQLLDLLSMTGADQVLNIYPTTDLACAARSVDSSPS